MALVADYSHQFMMECLQKQHDVETDVLKIALMDTVFAFDPDTHATWADCSANEIAGGFGYIAGGETLTTVAVTIDPASDKVDLTADSVTWTASGGAIPTVGAAVIYNSSHVNSTVVMAIDFGADYDTPDTKLFQINLSNGLGELTNV